MSKNNDIADRINHNKVLNAFIQLKTLREVLHTLENLLDIMATGSDWSKQAIKFIEDLENEFVYANLWTATRRAKAILQRNVDNGDTIQDYENNLANVVAAVRNIPEKADEDITVEYILAARKERGIK